MPVPQRAGSSLSLPTSRPAVPSGPRQVNYDREIDDPSNDTLGWAVRAKVLGDYLADHADTPLTVGIQGDWGSGKSSFINLFERGLGEKVPLSDEQQTEARKSQARHVADYRRDNGRHIYVIRFNSWTFAQSSYSADSLLPIYLAQAIGDYLKLRGVTLTDEQNAALKLMQVGVKYAVRAAKGLAALGAGIIAGGGAAEAVNEVMTTQPQQQTERLASFKEDFQALVDKLLTLSGTSINNQQPRDRLIVVVDDLDRITPLEAVEITEKIKVFLDVKGVIFVIAADLSIIQRGLSDKFGGETAQSDGKNYLDKIVKIQYNVPQLQGHDLAQMMLGYLTFSRAVGIEGQPASVLLNHDCLLLLRTFPSVGGNVRNIKRILLNFEFSHFLLNAGGQLVNEQHTAYRLLAITILHQYNADLARAFYNWLADPKNDGLRVAMPEPTEAPLQAISDFIQQLVGRREDERQVRNFFERLLARGYWGREWLAAYVSTTMSDIS